MWSTSEAMEGKSSRDIELARMENKELAIGDSSGRMGFTQVQDREAAEARARGRKLVWKQLYSSASMRD